MNRPSGEACGLAGPDRFRRSVTRVRQGTDSNGRLLDLIVIDVKRPGSHSVHGLSRADLLQGRLSGLIDLCREIGALDGTTDSYLAEIGAHLADYIAEPVVVLRHAGVWQVTGPEGGAFSCLAWRGKVYLLSEGASVKPVHVEDGPMPPPSCGTVADWNANVGVHFKGNDYMIVALGAALYAPLVRILGLPALSLLLVTGRHREVGALQSAVLSIVRPGAPRSRDKTSIRGLRQDIVNLADQPVMFRDVRGARDWYRLNQLITEIAVSADAGAGSDGIADGPISCGLIVSSFQGLPEHRPECRASREFGPSLRAHVMELELRAPHGAFHQLPEGFDAVRFSAYLNDVSNCCYGAIWDSYVEALVTRTAEIRETYEVEFSEIMKRTEVFAESLEEVTQQMLVGYTGWHAATRLAIRLGLIEPTPEDVRSAFSRVLAEYVEKRRD
ncbi:hypothetical protein J2W23_006247 [Variovorax boronicumulans]|uniref:hypothetical protein n=1 Tax=Variovorax boronicumulans TaxID=436515 RepID=UPI00278A615B|nr:hypothetical protein [Variovorax boronicumulans]MDQ0017831.1 hypothetical protein [Variovorax boronicumulans]